MKIITLFIMLVLISTIPLNSIGEAGNIFVGHINLNGNLIINYDGNGILLKQYFSKYHVSAYNYENYYLIYGNKNNISSALHVNNCSAFLPNYLASGVKSILSGHSVETNLKYATDPYFVKYILDAYDVNSFLEKGINGTGYTGVIVVPYGDPNIINNIKNYDSLNNISNINISTKYIFSEPTGNHPNWTVETDLDVEIMHSFAPGAKIILVVVPDDNSTSLELALLNVINEKLGNVISLSWGGPENEIYDPFFHYLLKKAAEAGITVISASGDTPDVEYPASDPYVLSVGGTTLYINENGYNGESIWVDSGGGFSNIFQRPPWQIGPGEFFNSGRGVPDIALDSNPETGVYIYSNKEVAVGGTSLAAPMFAGMVLDLEQKENKSFGFFTPELYYMNSINSSKYFNHIYINNSYTTGWYPQIGLGSPKILNWTFPWASFSTAVYLGFYNNVSKISFGVRGYNKEPLHKGDNNIYFLKLISGNKSLEVGFNQSNSKFFYNNSNMHFTNVSVINNMLFQICISISKRNVYLLIDNNNFTIQKFSDNFSMYVFAKSSGNFSFYTNLGPVEFRNFEILNKAGITSYPNYISAVNVSLHNVYGAMEIPFLKNDFLIGAIGVQGENVLWPRSFSYAQAGSINGNFLHGIPYLIGTGTSKDPYIISGLEINSSSIGFLYHGDKYFILNHCIINAPVGISIFGGYLKIIDSQINANIGIIGALTKITIINSTFYGILGMITPFSMTISFKNIYIIPYLNLMIFIIPEGNILFYLFPIISVIILIILMKKKKGLNK
ncbi:MAG: S53 family peptidase [Thermoplasmata archaeon]